MQDRLDGGISILMRCAGSEASEMLSPEHFTVDLYITPREHRETPERIGGDLSALVQAFSEEFVIPHLQRYAERCRIEGIIPPRHCESPLFPCSQAYFFQRPGKSSESFWTPIFAWTLGGHRCTYSVFRSSHQAVRT